MNPRQLTKLGLCVLAVIAIAGVWNITDGIDSTPQVSLTLTGFSTKRVNGGEHLYAHLQLTNASGPPARYTGYAADSPRYRTLYYTPTGWKQPFDEGWCGTGLDSFTLAPASAVTFKVGVERNELCKIGLGCSDDRKLTLLWEALPTWLTRRIPRNRKWRTVETGTIDTYRTLAVTYGSEITPEKSASILQADAEAGIVEAQFQLAGRYWTGNGLEKNLTEAIRWFETAATNGQAEAAYNLGNIHEHGLGATQDSAKALEWYRKAAQSGHAMALEKLVSLSPK